MNYSKLPKNHVVCRAKLLECKDRVEKNWFGEMMDVEDEEFQGYSFLLLVIKNKTNFKFNLKQMHKDDIARIEALNNEQVSDLVIYEIILKSPGFYVAHDVIRDD